MLGFGKWGKREKMAGMVKRGLEIAILEDLAKFHRTTLSQDKFKSERGSMYQLSVKLLTGGLE